MGKRLKKSTSSWVIGPVFFIASILYHELLLHFLTATPIYSFLGHVLVLAIAAGSLIALIFCGIPRVKVTRWIFSILSGLWSVLLCIEFICKMYYKTFFGLGYILSMSESVATGFGNIAFSLALKYSWFILLSFIPLIVFIIFRKTILAEDRTSKPVLLVLLVIFVVFQSAGSLWSWFGVDNSYYTYNYSANTAIPRFGLISSIRLELQYSIFGSPKIKELDETIYDVDAIDHPDASDIETNSLDINFGLLAKSAENESHKLLSNYFSSKKASQKNAYTGYFEGKNLIVITAESFSYGVIDETATPMLYKMTHEGFVFNNFYQPNWTQSTTGGEFSIMTGLIPTWINDNVSMYMSSKDSMPMALGNMFRSSGYSTTAWHNNVYNYYSRDITHPNLGYSYFGLYNGLTLTTGNDGNWPASDLEMAQVTLGNIIDQYKESGQPFHTYYMSVSGHGYYSWSQYCAKINRDAATTLYPDYPAVLQAYCAANLELEYMLEYMYNTLDEAGILDDTVICLCADHYPYALIAEDGTDYYDQLIGVDTDENDILRYKNSLILYCSDMSETIEINTPCSAIDIAPTLYNLFGLEFDSRLLSGHDIFATNYTSSAATSCMPLVILHTDYGYSWITAAGTYDAKKGTFTPNEGITVNDSYVRQVNKIIEIKFNYAKMIIESNYYAYCIPE